MLIFEFFEHFAALVTHLVPVHTFIPKLTHLGVAEKVERSWYFRWNCYGRNLQALLWFVIRMVPHVDPLKSLLIFEFFEHFAALFTHLVPAQTFNLKLTHLGVAKEVERSWYFRWNCHG